MVSLRLAKSFQLTDGDDPERTISLGSSVIVVPSEKVKLSKVMVGVMTGRRGVLESADTRIVRLGLHLII